jgi:hypothetical protein
MFHDHVKEIDDRSQLTLKVGNKKSFFLMK